MLSKLLVITGSSKVFSNIVRCNSSLSAMDKGKEKLFELMSVYEEAIGLKELKEAQQSVLDAEKRFAEAQNLRRDLNLKLLETQAKLRNLRDEMDRLSRTDSKYLQLFTEEHSILKQELALANEYKIKEAEERDLFFFLSSSLRDAQEKERARVERIKYLQLGLSVLCTTLGILSAYLFNYLRNSHIKEILEYDKHQFSNTQDLVKLVINNQIKLEKAVSSQGEIFIKKIDDLKLEQSKINDIVPVNSGLTEIKVEQNKHDSSEKNYYGRILTS